MIENREICDKIRNPLNSILGFIQVLRYEENLSDEDINLFVRIIENKTIELEQVVIELANTFVEFKGVE